MVGCTIHLHQAVVFYHTYLLRWVWTFGTRDILLHTVLFVLRIQATRNAVELFLLCVLVQRAVSFRDNIRPSGLFLSWGQIFFPWMSKIDGLDGSSFWTFYSLLCLLTCFLATHHLAEVRWSLQDLAEMWLGLQTPFFVREFFFLKCSFLLMWLAHW